MNTSMKDRDGLRPPNFGRNKRTEKTTIFNLFHTGCLACLSKWPKWNYFFCIDFPFFPFICIISYSPAMAGAWDRISMFWGERKIWEETYLHLKLLSPNGWRARVHYIGFKALEKITKHYWWQKAFKGIMGGIGGGWVGIHVISVCDTSS